MNVPNFSYVIYDIEIVPINEQIIDFDINNQMFYVGVSQDHNGTDWWYFDDIDDFVTHLLSFDKIVGFNIKGFDNVILDKYLPGCLKTLNDKSIDLMEIVEKQTGHRTSLDNLSKTTLEISKIANGSMVVGWSKTGKEHLISEYCEQDVKITEKLFIYGLENEEIKYEYHGHIYKKKINWIHSDKVFEPSEYELDDKESGKKIKLDANNAEFFQALEIVRTSNSNLFVTGKAGTGKTTFLKHVKSSLAKNTVILACTGVAAINAGGQTIHSFFKINPTEPPFTPWDNRLRLQVSIGDTDTTTIYSHFQYNRQKLEILRSLELLIIDEVSMVRGDFIDVVDKILRAYCRNKEMPFGGVQVLLIGDAFQLPPIEGKEWDILKEYYASPFFFDSQILQSHKPLQIELKKIYRQNEIEFIELLNRIRIDNPLDDDLILLNQKVRPITNNDFDNNYIVLCSTNRQVKEINDSRLNTLVGEEKIYEGKVTGTFPHSACMTSIYLSLKEGAQVMFLKNSAVYHNGRIGTVKSLENKEILVQLKDPQGRTHEVKVEKHTWENVTFSLNNVTKKIDRNVVGTFTQYPLKLAWAITVHKSQGLTFEKVAIDINDFAPSGLTYVALSRCTSFNGLILRQPLRRQAINTDSRVIKYAEEQTPDSLIVEILNHGQADEFYLRSRIAVKGGDFSKAYDTLITALRYRNDLETPNFLRYVLYILNSRIHFKKIAFEAQRKIKEISNSALQGDVTLRREIKAITEKLDKTKHELDEKIILIGSLKNSVAKVILERRNCDKELVSFKKEKSLLEDQLQKLKEESTLLIKKNQAGEKTVNVFDNERKKLKQEIIKLNQQLDKEKKENTRLHTLTWIDKLFGKK